MRPGFTIEKPPMIKEIIEENGRTIVIDHNNYDLIIDSVFGQRTISNKDSIKIFFAGESVRPKLENYYISIGFDYIDHPNYIRIPFIICIVLMTSVLNINTQNIIRTKHILLVS
ncbi:MAG: alpha-1,3-fucosyltransferase [Rickettsia aeschlimannii]